MNVSMVEISLIRKAAPPFPVANFVQPARPRLGAPDEIQSVFRRATLAPCLRGPHKSPTEKGVGALRTRIAFFMNSPG